LPLAATWTAWSAAWASMAAFAPSPARTAFPSSATAASWTSAWPRLTCRSAFSRWCLFLFVSHTVHPFFEFLISLLRNYAWLAAAGCSGVAGAAGG
jgi:hypothetical protein